MGIVTLGDIRRAHSPRAISPPCWPPAGSAPSSASRCRWHLPRLPPPSPAPSSRKRNGEFDERDFRRLPLTKMGIYLFTCRGRGRKKKAEVLIKREKPDRDQNKPVKSHDLSVKHQKLPDPPPNQAFPSPLCPPTKVWVRAWRLWSPEDLEIRARLDKASPVSPHQ